MDPTKQDITVRFISELVASQFPQWAAHLPIRPVELAGWDNVTFRLGDSMSVRLPSAEGYVPQVEKEHRWLPMLAPLLPLPIPTPVAMGLPAAGYPWQWSIYRWIEGEPATIAGIADPDEFAVTLARFLIALHRIDTTGGPAPGPHSFFRGAPPDVYDAETRRALIDLRGEIDVAAATSVWEAALAATWETMPVWVHGDVAAGNLLVSDGRLGAVIDFGCCAVGDPSCDLAIAWTFFSRESRQSFRSALPLDNATWARGRGWALWKALIALAEYIETNPSKAREARRVIEEVLADHRRAG